MEVHKIGDSVTKLPSPSSQHSVSSGEVGGRPLGHALTFGRGEDICSLQSYEGEDRVSPERRNVTRRAVPSMCFRVI